MNMKRLITSVILTKIIKYLLSLPENKSKHKILITALLFCFTSYSLYLKRPSSLNTIWLGLSKREDQVYWFIYGLGCKLIYNTETCSILFPRLSRYTMEVKAAANMLFVSKREIHP